MNTCHEHAASQVQPTHARAPPQARVRRAIHVRTQTHTQLLLVFIEMI